MNYIDWGLIDYKEALERQQTIFEKKLRAKQQGEALEDDWIFCEHNSVITLGRHADEKNILLAPGLLREKSIECVHIERGGDVTFHAPGQLVAYPILDLENYGFGLKKYVWALEETVIRTIAEFGVEGQRKASASGVWIAPDSDSERKICALGIRSSLYITMHGFALNVNTDLEGFSFINPCGFPSRAVTSLEKETGRNCPLELIKSRMITHSSEIFLSLF